MGQAYVHPEVQNQNNTKQPRQAVLYERAWRGLIQTISSDLTTTHYHRRKNTNSRIIDTPQQSEYNASALYDA